VYAVLGPTANEMHYRHVTPETAEFYRKNKRFVDGIVKKVLATTHARLTAGDIEPGKREH